MTKVIRSQGQEEVALIIEGVEGQAVPLVQARIGADGELQDVVDSEGNVGDAIGGSQPAILLAELLFEEGDTAGVYTATIDLEPGSDVVGWQATPLSVWAADFAVLDIADDLAGEFAYAGAVGLTSDYISPYDPLDQNAGRINADVAVGGQVLSGPSSGGNPITAVDQGGQKFTIGGPYAVYFEPFLGQQIQVVGSSGNDGNYTFSSVSQVGEDTVFTVDEPIPDATADGSISPSFDTATAFALYTIGNAFYLWAQYGNSVRYPDGGTITAKVTTSGPHTGTGVLRVRIAYVPPVTASDAEFSPS